MNNLTAHNIQNISSNISKNVVLHPTSIGYIQNLITPYAQILDQANSVKDVTDWIPKALPLLVSPISVDIAVDKLVKLKGGIKEGTEFVQLAKNTVVNILIGTIISSVDNDIIFYKSDNMILPWDIKESMFFHNNLLESFGIVKGDNKLPVEIIIDNKSYEHQLTEEFTMGLLLYSLVAQKPIHIKLFGIPLSYDYFLNPQGNRYTKFCSDARRTEYSVVIGGVNYCFITPDFMQGIATGASWYNDDHHKYWTDLISYEINPKGVLVNF